MTLVRSVEVVSRTVTVTVFSSVKEKGETNMPFVMVSSSSVEEEGSENERERENSFVVIIVGAERETRGP